MSAQRTTAALVAAFAAAVSLAGGCVERRLVVETDPPGALVYMNDQEVGRTPFSREFEWYGTYDVVVRAPGHETLKTRTPVIAPPWLWVPFDLVAELLPVTIHDTHRLRYTLQPTTEAEIAPEKLFARARELQTQLQSGERTVVKPLTTRPASSTRPATQAGN